MILEIHLQFTFVERMKQGNLQPFSFNLNYDGKYVSFLKAKFKEDFQNYYESIQVAEIFLL